MPRAARQPRRLTDARLEEMLAPIRHADSVELKQTKNRTAVEYLSRVLRGGAGA
jgi:hypothetical protein